MKRDSRNPPSFKGDSRLLLDSVLFDDDAVVESHFSAASDFDCGGDFIFGFEKKNLELALIVVRDVIVDREDREV